MYHHDKSMDRSGGRDSGSVMDKIRSMERKSSAGYASPSTGVSRSSRPSVPMPPPAGDPQGQGQQGAIVTPELLVDALSGHEDGLLAIAERLMEHYDSGYDAMGEAIIDAFADVQKLFQHVVEAAHMEGAAFEASRREEEMGSREAASDGAGGGGNLGAGGDGRGGDYGPRRAAPDQDGGPTRHDEFIDQDVRDVLNDAIRQARPLREAGNHAECYALFEDVCNSASALLPVDSDHRGRLQLSIARAESMSADRACAILKYAIDDVLRSGLSVGVGSVGEIDFSKRGDMVLDRPSPASAIDGLSAVAQSADEALASLVEELKDVLAAPVYDNSPLRSVAARFWEALADAQRSNVKHEEFLEQKLASLKAEYLLAREEWEEKLSGVRRENEALRLKYNRLLNDSDETSSQFMENARKALGSGEGGDLHHNGAARGGGYLSRNGAFEGERRYRPTTGSVASLGSGLAHHARNLVGTLNCVGNPNGERPPFERSRSSERRAEGF